MQFELLLQRRSVVGEVGVPGLEVGFGEFEDAKAAILLADVVKVELVGLLVFHLLDDAADPLFGDVGNGRVVLAACRFGKLDEDELAIAAVLFVQVEDGVGGGAGTGEEVEDNMIIS